MTLRSETNWTRSSFPSEEMGLREAGHWGRSQGGRTLCLYPGQWPFNLCPSVGCISFWTSQAPLASGSTGPRPGVEPSTLTCSTHWLGAHGFRPCLFSQAPPLPTAVWFPTPAPGQMDIQDLATQSGPTSSPRGCVATELPQPLGIIAHGSIEHAD